MTQQEGYARPSPAATIAALGIVAAAVLFLANSPDSFELPKRAVWATLALALSILAVFARSRQRGVPVAFCLGTALSLFMACRTLISSLPFWRSAEPLMAWLLPLCLFLASSSIAWNKSDVRAVARVVVALGVAEALLMILQRLGLDPLFGEVTRGFPYAPERMIGTVGYQNQAAELLGLALFCIPACGFGKRAVEVSAAFAIAATIILTANRGAIAAMLVAGGCWGWRRMRTSRAAVAKSAGVAILFLVAILAMPEPRCRVLELVHPGDSVAVESRKWMGKVAVSLFSNAPVFGCGAGEFAYSYLDTLGELLPSEKNHGLLRQIVWARETHNDPLQFLAEFGSMGFAILAAFAVFAWRESSFRLPALFLTVCSLFSFSWQTSMAAPLAGLLLGIDHDSEKRTIQSVWPIHSLTLAFGAALFALALILNWANLGIEEAYFQELEGGKSPFLRGRMRFEAAKVANSFGDQEKAFSLAIEAERDFLSPELISFIAVTLQRKGLANESLAYWRRLEKSGLMYEETLRHESKALESMGQLKDAAAKEAERFRLWGNRFTDDELYRYCALSLMTGDGNTANLLSRSFHRRCIRHGEKGKWTPEWSNLRGGALLAVGRRSEARKYFEDAIARKPSLDSAKKNLENCAD